MIDSGFCGNVRNWMESCFHALTIIHLYLAVCHGAFRYNDYLDEVKHHLPTDYLFKIPLLDSTCNEKWVNYLQVKWTLGCIIQRDKDKTTQLFYDIGVLFNELSHCQNISKKICHLDGHLQYVTVTQFQEKYSEAYEHQHKNGHISCSCLSTNTAVTTKDIPVRHFFLSTSSMQVKTLAESGSTSNPSQSTATTDIPTTRPRDITEAVPLTTNATNLDSGSLLTTTLPLLMEHMTSGNAWNSAIVIMAIIIVLLFITTLCLYRKNRELRYTQTNIPVELQIVKQTEKHLLHDP